MSCDNCGMAAQGRLCRTCELSEHQEDYYGVPEDHFEDDADVEEGDA